MNRCLFERDKMMFKLMVTLKIMVVGQLITAADMSMFFKAGSALDIKTERSNPYRWMPDKVWLNLIQASRHPFGTEQLLFFREIVDLIGRNESNWKKWYDENEPEN